ncbi:unnamed protein product [Chrysoparadoxa australica]
MESKKIDCYTHFCCPAFMAHLEERSGHDMVFRGLFNQIPELTSVEARLAYMDKHGIEKHCLVPLPWLECEPSLHANLDEAITACQCANNEMSKVQAAHPDRFIGIALVPTSTAEGMVAEAKRAVRELNLNGIALFCGPTVKPLDDPSFDPLYQACEEMDVPIWVHPCRPQQYADYDAYAGSEGSKHQIWNTLGWIYDTSVSMVHMALGGVFRRYPGLKVVSHHHGGMIPFFTERFHTQMRNFRDDSQEDLINDLKLFYCDTATFGVNSGNIRQALDFFGPDRVMFGTDTPMDMGESGFFTTTTMASIEGLVLDKEMVKKVMHGNVEALLSRRSTERSSL